MLISIFLRVFREMNIVLGMYMLWIFLGGRCKNRLYFGSFLCFRVFSKVNVQNGNIFGSLKFKILFWYSLYA